MPVDLIRSSSTKCRYGVKEDKTSLKIAIEIPFLLITIVWDFLVSFLTYKKKQEVHPGFYLCFMGGIFFTLCPSITL